MIYSAALNTVVAKIWKQAVIVLIWYNNTVEYYAASKKE